MVDSGSGMNRGMTIALGVILILLGLAAIFTPLYASVAATLLLGAVMLVAGIVVFVFSFSNRQWKGFLMNFLGGILLIIIGALLAFDPLAGAVTLSVLLMIYLIVGGFFNLVTGFRIKPDSQWGMYVFGGIVSLILGFLILAAPHAEAVWIMGLLIGLNILIIGFVTTMLGMNRQ